VIQLLLNHFSQQHKFYLDLLPLLLGGLDALPPLFDGLLPRPFPDELPVVLGPLLGLAFDITRFILD